MNEEEIFEVEIAGTEVVGDDISDQTELSNIMGETSEGLFQSITAVESNPIENVDGPEKPFSLLEEPNTEEKVERITKLPLSRIKQIMKMDPELKLASQDAVFLISKSTELFIQTLSKEAHAFTIQGKKKTIQKKDVEAAVSSSDCLVFLDGALDLQ